MSVADSDLGAVASASDDSAWYEADASSYYAPVESVLD